MSLSEWIREYREYPIDEASRPARRPTPRFDPAPPQPLHEESVAPYVVLSGDRPRDRTPRWLRRAERVGYAPARAI